MVSVGEVIEQVVEKLGIGDKLCEQQALTRLPDVVESVLGNRTDVCPVGFRLGELTLSTGNSALRHRLMFERERIRRMLNDAVGRDAVRSIRIGWVPEGRRLPTK